MVKCEDLFALSNPPSSPYLIPGRVWRAISVLAKQRILERRGSSNTEKKPEEQRPSPRAIQLNDAHSQPHDVIDNDGTSATSNTEETTGKRSDNTTVTATATETATADEEEEVVPSDAETTQAQAKPSARKLTGKQIRAATLIASLQTILAQQDEANANSPDIEAEAQLRRFLHPLKYPPRTNKDGQVCVLS